MAKAAAAEKRTDTVGFGIQLSVPGAALAAQVAARVAWHKRTSSTLGDELKRLPAGESSELSTAGDWHQHQRRTELRRLILAHDDYARFLEFVKRHLNRRQTYQLSLSDLAALEIMPKGSYL